jgi:cysteine desulfurase family protein
MPENSIYLNNAATTWPKPECVAKAMAAFLEGRGANLARGSASQRDLGTLDMVTTCRMEIASLLGGPDADPRNATFTANVTESLNIVLKGFLEPGMRVSTSSMEHNAVMRPLRRLESEGVQLSVMPCTAEGFLEPETLARELERGLDLVVFSHASNVCGTVQDMENLAPLCESAGVPLVLDTAQTAGVLPIDATRWNLAACCFTGHKGLLGPQGTGGILWRDDFAAECRPLIEGGTGSFSHEEVQPSVLPDRFEAGTPNLPGLAGLLASLGWLEETGIGTIRRREDELGQRLLAGLLEIPGITIYGKRTMEGRLPVFALNFDSLDNGRAALELADRWGIETRPGLHCAPVAHKTIRSFPQGALRISPGYFNTEEEIDLCLEALAALSRENRRS